MELGGFEEYWVPTHVRDYLRGLGFVLPIEDMEPWIRDWHMLMGARGPFYDYRDTDGLGRVYEVHRRSIRPAMRVCSEWGSLLLNENVRVVCDDQGATDWLRRFFSATNFMSAAQATVMRAFGLGTGAWALWVDTARKAVRVRHYDARMVVPLSWDEEGVSECAFVTRAHLRGRAVDQLQMHLVGADGTYRIETACFDACGNRVDAPGVLGSYETGSERPTFGIVRPAVTNTRVDMSPYGQSVFADAVDAIQAVDLTFDALVNEVDVSKMRVFLSDVLFDRERSGDKTVSIPFGKADCTVFRKVMSTDDMVQEFAPALRTGAQAEAFRIALQMLGDQCGFGIGYFDFDDARGYDKTATEVSSDNSALMRNIRKHENALEGALCDISRAVMCASRGFGEKIPDEGGMRVMFDDSIIQDVAAEKAQDMAEVGVTMAVWEYRRKWYGEDERTAKGRAQELMGAQAG